MRSLTAFLVMLLSATVPELAYADITAEYFAWGPIGPTIKIQVADNGNARVETGGRLAAVRREGVMYLVREDRDGRFVLRADEFARIEAQIGADRPFPEEPDIEDARIVEAGEEMVGGRRGTILVFQDAPGPVEVRDRQTAFVVSRDADLRPVGEVLAEILGQRGPLGTGLGHAALRDRGTMIRMWFMIRLERTSAEQIPAAAFDLPGPVLGGDEARARLGAAW